MSNSINRVLPHIQVSQELNRRPPEKKSFNVRVSSSKHSNMFINLPVGTPLKISFEAKSSCQCHKATDVFTDRLRWDIRKKNEIIKQQKKHIEAQKERIKATKEYMGGLHEEIEGLREQVGDLDHLLGDIEETDNAILDNERCLKNQDGKIKKKKEIILKLNQKIEKKKELLLKRSREDREDGDLPPAKRTRFNSSDVG